MIKQKLLAFVSFALLGSVLAGAMSTAPSYAATNQQQSQNNCNQRFLTLPPWYRGLASGSDCTIDVNAVTGGATQSDKLRIFIQILALNIVEIMMHIVAYVCIAFIIIGGFKYITSAGSPDGNSSGRQTIQNALIGLVISMVSIGIVNFVTGGMI